MNHLLKYPLWCVLLSLAGACGALATEPLYQNLSPVSFTIPGNSTNIDAFAFDNESEFDVNYFTGVLNVDQFETQNTIYYTNNGTMVANASIATNGLLLSSSIGCGFNFDQQVTNQNSRLMAGTFFNDGNIFCDSTNTGNNVLIFTGSLGGQAEFIQTSVGVLTISATNVINPGTLDVGTEGLLQINSQNADLTRGQLTIEGGISGEGLNSLGFVGTDTNGEWDPGLDLTPTNAISSISGISGFNFNQLVLTNSTSYFDIQQTGPSNRVIRAVFLQDNSVNTATNVYIDNVFNSSLLGFAAGAAHVEWVGHYLDPASGQTFSNYLYLTDDYALGASTNVLVVDGNGGLNSGIPDNFTFFSSPTPVLTNSTPLNSSFPPNIFPVATITNPYAYFNAQLLATVVATNASLSNPHGVLTNMLGRLQITASQDLNLTLVSISGPSYLSLIATNQYDGSAGAAIAVPYADISLGATNGNMAVSNLLMAAIPAWSGTVQAWSTRWLGVDSSGVTNDYRVMLVKSQLSPFSTPQVDHLTLHATNSLNISDVLGVFGSVFIDANNLTLTTNIVGAGATSLTGELNWESTAVLGSSQLPNLLWLTNNGTISSFGLLALGSGAVPYGAVINNGLMLNVGATIFATNFVSSGIISNGGLGSFSLQSSTATATNGSLMANGSVSITANTFLTGGLSLSAGRALNLTLTNLLTDTGATNGAFWSVGASNGGSGIAVGLNLPVKPVMGDLLATTITNIAVSGTFVTDTWSGQDRGAVNAGFSNNAAIGQLVVDARSPSLKTGFNFTGSGASNAMYVDNLILEDSATNMDGSENVSSFTFNTNLVIYYAQATESGVSVAEKLDHANNNHLRWVPTYVGMFSSTNLGGTNLINSALAQSSDIDSDGDGVANSSDSSPFFTPSRMNFTMVLTNMPPPAAKLVWQTVPGATNYVYYKTNLLSPNWMPLTNFISPQPYPSPATNVWMFQAVTNIPHFYQVVVQPWMNRGEPAHP